MTDKGRFDCVFFSRISPEKGADVVLETARRLSNVTFAFYGQIDRDYEAAFLSAAEGLKNVTYKGIFDSAKDDPVEELTAYDLHLFPTRWPNEGVPGVLVETKLAGVPSVVSDICYNAELVRDGTEGVVLEECSADCLVDVIEGLSENSAVLDGLKTGALASSDRFYIDRYIDLLVSDLEDGRKEALDE